MAYLQHGFQPPSTINDEQSLQNPRSDHYEAPETGNVDNWTAFNLPSIQQLFGATFTASKITDEPVSHSPPPPVNSKIAVRSRIHTYMTNRVVRAL